MVHKALGLKGRVVALTRPAGQAEEAGRLIEQKGGVPYYIPAIEIKPLINLEPVKRFVAELQTGKVNYVIFMSTNGVKYLFRAAESLKLAGELKSRLSKSFVIAVGPRTAQELEVFGVHVGLVPEKYSSEGLIECLKGEKLLGKTIRIPRTTSANPTLTNQLKALGADVEEIHVYESGLPVDESLKERFLGDLQAGKINAIVFGSGLSAKNIFKMLSEKEPMEKLKAIIARKVTVVAIGPTTAEVLMEMGVRVDVMPKDYMFETALSALADYWNKR
jgi:uroporphyrinogen-III synthase